MDETSDAVRVLLISGSERQTLSPEDVGLTGATADRVTHEGRTWEFDRVELAWDDTGRTRFLVFRDD